MIFHALLSKPIASENSEYTPTGTTTPRPIGQNRS